MESQFFECSGWDQHDTMCFGFYDAVLKVQVGQFPAGTKFESAMMDYEKGEMTFENYNEDGSPKETFVFKLRLVVES